MRKIQQPSDDRSHRSPALIFMVWTSWKTKVKFVSETPLSVALLCRTQPVSPASPSWIIAFLRTGGQLWCKERHPGGEPVSWDLMKEDVSGTSASRRNHDSLAQGQESPLLTPALCRPCCDPGSLGWLCLSQKPTHFHGWQGAGIQMKEVAVGALMAPPALGKVGQGTTWHKGPCLPHLGLCGLSICLLTVKMDRQGALRLSNSFSIFFQQWKNSF